MAPAGGGLTPGQVAAWCTDGYLVVPAVVPAEACAALLEGASDGGRHPDGDRLLADERLLAVASALLDAEARFVQQRTVVQQPGDYGEPWHQDAASPPREPDDLIVVMLALTEATLANGCAWVVPGSHREPVHDHRPDRRPGGRPGAVELTATGPERGLPVPLVPGDLLVVDSHLTYRSTDNHSRDARAARVCHCRPSRALGVGT